MIQAGQLNKLVTIEQQDPDPDRYQEYTPATNGKVWASIEPLTGRERWEAQAIEPKATYRIRMWFWPGLTSAHRLVYGDRIFELLSPPVDVDERGVEFELMCSERTA
jgi:SPP1 family predicted phage head-tail adaptor